MSSTAGSPTENLGSLPTEELLSKIELQKEEGRLDKAYEAALQLFHKDNRYILHLAHFVHGHYVEKNEECLAALLSIVDRVPTGLGKADVHFRIGNSYYIAKDYKNALLHFFESYRITPDRDWLLDYVQNCIAYVKSAHGVVANSFFSEQGATLEVYGESIDGTEKTQRNILSISPKSRWALLSGARFFPLDMPTTKGFRYYVDLVAEEALPTAPIFRSDDKILTLGSCFAAHFRSWLLRHGKLATNISMPEDLNNTAAVNSFIEWCVTGTAANDVHAFARTQDGDVAEFNFTKDRALYQSAFAQAGGIVITYGVGEVLCDRVTGKVFWQGIPKDLFDKDRHTAMISDVDWNYRNIRRTIDTLRAFSADLRIVITLSPVPLNATFRNRTIWEADAASKAVLRAAIEKVVGDELPGVYYWPSFEMVKWLGPHIDMRTFSSPQEDPVKEVADTRHVLTGVVNEVVSKFVEKYFAE